LSVFSKKIFLQTLHVSSCTSKLGNGPSNAKYDVPIGKLPKKGRLPKAKKALVVMNDKTNSLV
jgi:hypothetical protein